MFGDMADMETDLAALDEITYAETVDARGPQRQVWWSWFSLALCRHCQKMSSPWKVMMLGTRDEPFVYVDMFLTTIRNSCEDESQRYQVWSGAFLVLKPVHRLIYTHVFL